MNLHHIGFTVPISRKIGKVRPSIKMDGFVVNQDLRNDMLRHMDGLKKEIDLSFLTGRELIQVAIGSFQVQFHFDEDVAVSVEGGFNYFDGKAEWIWRPEPGAAQIAGRTVALLGAAIESFAGHEDGTLMLAFSNGQRLDHPRQQQGV